jgi:acyl carrier protein
MTEQDIYSTLNELFSDIFLRDGIVLNASTKADDVEGWDSYKQVEIILAVSEHFQIKLTNREVDGLKTVGDLVRIIQEKLAK